MTFTVSIANGHHEIEFKNGEIATQIIHGIELQEFNKTCRTTLECKSNIKWSKE